MKLLTILLAFAMFRWLEKPHSIKSFDWVESLHQWLAKRCSGLDQVYALTLVTPLLVMLVAFSSILAFEQDSLLHLLLHVVIVYYCLGPETMKSLLDSHHKVIDEVAQGSQSETEQLINHMTDAAMHRWFGVFFWYAVLGVYGAVLFRMVCHLQQVKIDKDDDSIRATLKLLEFPVAVLMTVSLALASDFDRIWKHCKQYLNGETIRTLNSQFLYKSMDYAVEQCEVDTAETHDVKIIGITTYTVLTRMLVVWLVFAALMVIFSIG